MGTFSRQILGMFTMRCLYSFEPMRIEWTSPQQVGREYWFKLEQKFSQMFWHSQALPMELGRSRGAVLFGEDMSSAEVPSWRADVVGFSCPTAGKLVHGHNDPQAVLSSPYDLLQETHCFHFRLWMNMVYTLYMKIHVHPFQYLQYCK